MVVRVDVAPKMLAWARARSRRDDDYFQSRFPKLSSWQKGELSPTLSQLESFANATYTPIGYLFLDSPPEERLPIPDFRTIRDADVTNPSPNLIDSIALCEQRQEWFRDFAISSGETPVEFVGSLQTAMRIDEAADSMRPRFGFELEMRGEFSSWAETLSGLAQRSEEIGILVMISGIVGSNTHRKLDPQEFRGFALTDDFAPLVFVNGSDAKSAQIFTLAHELVHIGLGQSAISSSTFALRITHQVERWCNGVAAELLVPIDSLRETYSKDPDLFDELNRLARLYRVSTLVILRRIHDANLISWDHYRAAYAHELEQGSIRRESAGGDFYSTLPVRVSKRFAKALVASTLAGQTLHRDALRLLGFKSYSTFDELSRRFGMA